MLELCEAGGAYLTAISRVGSAMMGNSMVTCNQHASQDMRECSTCLQQHRQSSQVDSIACSTGFHT